MNQSFTFDVRELKTAQITVHVVARGVLGIEEALGHVNSLCVLNLLEVHMLLLPLCVVQKNSVSQGLFSYAGGVLILQSALLRNLLEPICTLDSVGVFECER